MSEFNDKFDEIVQRTGAGTEVFKNDVKKRLKTVSITTLISVVTFLLNTLAIRYSWWPESDAFKALAGYIFLLSALLVVMGLLGLFIIWFQGYVYNKMAEYSKNKKS